MRSKTPQRAFSPALFIGLGDLGMEIAEIIAGTITSRVPTAAPVVSHIGFSDAGKMMVRGTLVPDFSCTGLDTTQGPGAYATNFKAIQAVEQDILILLAEELTRLRRHDVLTDLADKGISVDDEIHIYLCSPLCDAVGSALLLPFVGYIQTLLSGRLTGDLLQLDIIGFFPDLFNDFRSDESAFMRSYCCVQELDCVGEDPRLVSPQDRPPYTNIFLFSAKNEDGIEVSSFRELVPMIGGVIHSILSGEIASDTGFSRALFRKVEDKRARYSSFAMVKLVLPVEEIMAGLRSYSTSRILEGHALSGKKTFEKELVNSDAKDFILANQLDGLPSLMEVDDSGKRIEVPFRFNDEAPDRMPLDEFVRQLGVQEEQFENTERAGMDRRLVQRRTGLNEAVEKNLSSKLEQCMDDKNLGPYYAVAFLELLGGIDSDRLTGAASRELNSVKLIERQAKRFFDEILEVDRDRVARLERDLEDKRSLLERWREEDAEDVEEEGDGDEAPPEADEQYEEAEEYQKEPGLSPRLRDLMEGIETLAGEHADLLGAVKACDFRIADPSERRHLLERQETELQNQRKERHEEAGKVESQLADSVRERSALKEAFRRMTPEALAVPLASFILLVLVFQVTGNMVPSFSPWRALLSLRWTLSLLVLGYYGWEGFRVWTRGWVPYQAKVVEVQREETKKKRAFRAIEANVAAAARLRFSHGLHGHLIDWVTDLRMTVERMRNTAVAFVQTMEEEGRRHSLRFEELELPSTPFARSVLGPPEIQQLIEKNPRFEVAMKGFFREQPLSTFFREFQPQRTLDALLGAVGELTESVFQNLRKVSIEDFMVEEERGGQPLSPKLNNLYASVRAFILLDVEKGLDASESVVFIGVENEETSRTLEEFRRRGHQSLEAYSTGRRSEITVAKLKIGFPAFHIAPIKYGRALLMQAKDPTGWTAEREWVAADLMPSAYTIGGEGDEIRRLATLACGLGLVASLGGEFTFENELLGDSFEGLVVTLRSFKGRTMRARVGDLLKVEMGKDDAVERLVAYRDSAGLDQVDVRIINETIMEISPLA